MRTRVLIAVAAAGFLPAPLVAADPASVQAEVQGVLSEMTRAVLAADADAFLTHVAPDDRFFATEWKHWAAMLAGHKPDEFSLSIGDGPASFADDRAEFPLVMSWRISSGPKESWGAGGEKRAAAFPPVIFTREDPDGPGPLPPRWLFHGEKWERLEGERFVVCYLPGSEEVAREVAQAFPIARDHDNEGFGVKPPPQVLKLFTSMDHLKATVYLSMPDAVLGGWSEPGESIKFLTTYTRGVRNWTNAYAHEYAHVCTWELVPGMVHMPWFVEEGVAELAAMEFRPGYWQRLDADMRRDAREGRLTPWDEITDYMTARQSLKRRAYTQGHHLLGYISLRWDREGRNRWLRLMASGSAIDEATRRAFGRSFGQLDREWREDLGRPHHP